MDVAFFLNMRTEFIRSYYDTARAPFLDRMQRITDGAPPYDDVPDSEDPEPPFLQEWSDADLGLQVLGRSCISMLSDSLKLYFETLRTRVIGFKFTKEAEQALKRNGFVPTYRDALAEILDTDWTDCPVDFAVIEQVVLTRNRSQHGEHLASLYVTHDDKTLEKHPRPFFATPEESDGLLSGFLSPAVKVTRENLFEATYEAERLARWVESRGRQITAWRQRRRDADAPVQPSSVRAPAYIPSGPSDLGVGEAWR